MKNKWSYFISLLFGLALSSFLLFNNNSNYYNISNFLEVKGHEDSLIKADVKTRTYDVPLMELNAFAGKNDSVVKYFFPIGFKLGIDSLLKSSYSNETYRWIIMNNDTNNIKFLIKARPDDTWVKQIDNYQLYDYYNVDFDSVYERNIKEYEENSK